MGDEEFRVRVGRIAAWFQELSPYDSDDPLFKLEDENFALRDGKATGEPEKLYAFAVSAKRYCLFNLDSQGRPVLRRGSAHGLGYLHPPYDDDESPPDIPPPAVPLKKLGLHRWEYDLWYRIATAALGPTPADVTLDFAGFAKPAASHYSATKPDLLSWFAEYNRQHPERERVRPFGFLLAFQADGRLYPDTEMPPVIAPYDPDPPVAAGHAFNRKTGGLVEARYLKTYARVLEQYHLHPEAKFLNAGQSDSGTTVRRHVVVKKLRWIGKEANRWDEQAATGEDPEAQIEYIPDVDIKKLRADCRQFKVRELAREAGLSPSAVSAFVRAKGSHDRITLMKLREGVERLTAKRDEEAAETASLLMCVQECCESETTSRFARRAGVDRGTLQAILRGRRRPGRYVLGKLAEAVTKEPTRESTGR